MGDETHLANFDWSYDAYNAWATKKEEEERGCYQASTTNLIAYNEQQEEQEQQEQAKKSYQASKTNLIINCIIAIALILGFLGFIFFPQILIPGSMLLSACLIGSQALSGFAILATCAKTAHALYDMGWKEALRMILCGPRRFFTGHTAQACLLLLGFLAIGTLLVLSGVGILNIPFLTVFAAKSLSLEVLEILWGLVSDIALIGIAGMGCYLFSLVLGKQIDKVNKGVVAPMEDTNEDFIQKKASTAREEGIETPIDETNFYQNRSNLPNTIEVIDDNLVPAAKKQ